ncbi:MAG: hypothetical protein LQ340_006291 [Diploschistes diacapsis]|nr:MAG: hypothetical protein LQ340_006291 [Diploschistes diacapsis]
MLVVSTCSCLLLSGSPPFVASSSDGWGKLIPDCTEQAPNHSLTRTDTRYMCSPSPTPEDWWRHNAWPIARHISSHHRATEASDTTAATATLASAGSKISAGLAKETSKTAATQNEDNEVASSAIVKDKREPTEANAEELHRHGPAVARTMTTSSTKCKAARAATVTVSRWMNVPRREAIDPLAILNKVNATSPAASRMETLRHGHVSSHVAPSPTAISVHTEVRVHTAMVIKPPQTFTVVEGFAGSVIGVEMNGRTSVMTTVTESVSRTTLGLEPSPAVKLEERQESVTARVGAIIQSVGPDGVGVPISTIWDDDQYTPLAAVTFPPTL